MVYLRSDKEQTSKQSNKWMGESNNDGLVELAWRKKKQTMKTKTKKLRNLNWIKQFECGRRQTANVESKINALMYIFNLLACHSNDGRCRLLICQFALHFKWINKHVYYMAVIHSDSKYSSLLLPVVTTHLHKHYQFVFCRAINLNRHCLSKQSVTWFHRHK